ncbi:MAG: cation transport protein ChaC [Oceanicoccus sp.]|jgi:cation transport protein ChaC
MNIDTSRANKALDFFDRHESLWLFAYGSIIFKVDFDYIERRPASIEHFSRRFWQGSHDHRGTVAAPGRVVTLVPDDNAQCLGMAYRITPAVFQHLDHREKNGYLRQKTPLYFGDGSEEIGLIYIADNSNAAYLGPASDADIAAQIAQSNGPSGSNKSYLLDLAQALRQLGSDDEHIFALERLVLAL